MQAIPPTTIGSAALLGTGGAMPVPGASMVPAVWWTSIDAQACSHALGWRRPGDVIKRLAVIYL